MEGFRNHIAFGGSLKRWSRGKIRLVVGQWRSLTMTLEQNRGTLPMVPCWRSWTCRERSKEQKYGFHDGESEMVGPVTIHTDSMDIWMGYGEERKVALGQNKNMPTYGNMFGNCV